MAEDDIDLTYTSFLGTGWSFPPEFVWQTGGLRMASDEDDIHESLMILLGTVAGERFLNPKYGIDMHEVLFEPMSTTMLTELKDKVKTALLVYEARVNLLSLDLDTSGEYEGVLNIIIEYEVRSTNSRFNLVYPFYLDGGNEMRATVNVIKL